MQAWLGGIYDLMKEIDLPDNLKNFVDSKASIAVLDPKYSRSISETAKILGDLHSYQEALSFYAGYPISDKQPSDFTSIELRKSIDEVKGANLTDKNSVKRTLEIIGQSDSFDCRQNMSRELLHGRDN